MNQAIVNDVNEADLINKKALEIANSAEQEKNALLNLKRILMNGLQLLTNEGVFHGKHAGALTEVVGYMQWNLKQVEDSIGKSGLILPSSAVTSQVVGDVKK